jgi:uncharacterized protein
MRLRLSDIPAEGAQLKASLDAETLPELKALNAKGECRFTAPIQVKLQIEPLADVYAVVGRVQTSLELVCNRCLEQFQEALQSEFRLTLSPEAPGANSIAGPVEREVDPAAVEQVFFQADEFDFRDLVQEQILLALPMRPLCREDCQGLCASCGRPKRLGNCGCIRETGDPRLAVLKRLKLDR